MNQNVHKCRPRHKGTLKVPFRWLKIVENPNLGARVLAGRHCVGSNWHARRVFTLRCIFCEELVYNI